MRTVGVRALQQNAAMVLRRVRRGETVEVTDRGRLVARLVPAVGTDVLEVLEKSGSLQRAQGDLLDLGEPLGMPRGAETASKRLAKMRKYER